MGEVCAFPHVGRDHCRHCGADFACSSCGHVWDTVEQRRVCARSHMPPFPRFEELEALKRERRG